MSNLAVEKIEEAIALRERLEKVKVELVTIRSLSRVTRVGNEVRTVVIWEKPEGPLLANGMFITRRCPTCGHRT